MAPRRGAASDVASMHNALFIEKLVTYSDARADGFPCHEALELAAIDGMNPTPIGYSEIRDAAEAYNSQVEEKLKVNRGRFRQTLEIQNSGDIPLTPYPLPRRDVR